MQREFVHRHIGAKVTLNPWGNMDPALETYSDNRSYPLEIVRLTKNGLVEVRADKKHFSVPPRNIVCQHSNYFNELVRSHWCANCPLPR